MEIPFKRVNVVLKVVPYNDKYATFHRTNEPKGRLGVHLRNDSCLTFGGKD